MTIACCKCGQPVRQVRKGGEQTLTDRAMNTYTRHRVCACGGKTTTVELPASELAELRRCAHVLLRLQQGSV